jgi:hypothetical protein
MAMAVYNDVPDALAVLTAKNRHVRPEAPSDSTKQTDIKGTFFTEEVCCVRIGHLRLRRHDAPPRRCSTIERARSVGLGFRELP